MLKKLKESKLSLAQTYNRFSPSIFRSTPRIPLVFLPNTLRDERLADVFR
jgi:hypothetical protein